MNILGFEIKRKKKVEKLEQIEYSNAPDGALEIIDVGLEATGGAYVELFDTGALPKEEFDLIKTYREASLCTELDKATSEIINDLVTIEDDSSYPVKINVDDIELSDKIKQKFVDEFENILQMMRFNVNAYDYIRRWYIDGRIRFHLIVSKTEKKGIKKIVMLDSLYTKKIRKILKDNDGIIKKIEEYYIYTPPVRRSFYDHFTKGSYTTVKVPNYGYAIKLTGDSVAESTSGIIDDETGFVLSHLQKALKPLNQLNLLENSAVIYRVVRAPERRVFYIDVGNLPKNKAEAYLSKIMAKYRNKLAYNDKTGKIEDKKRFLSMLEDYWLPRREGGKGTEIDTLSGGENLNQVEDMMYFRKKLYESLNIPLSRIDSESVFAFGKDGEITREEIKFSKFINRLRVKFSNEIFNVILKNQLILKRIISLSDWEKIESKIRYVWVEDSHFAEIKFMSILRDRIDLINDMDEMTRKYFSENFVRTHILRQTEQEIQDLKKEREEEKKEREKGEEEDRIMGDGGASGGFGNDMEYEEEPENDEIEKDNEEEKDKNKKLVKTKNVINKEEEK